MTRPVIACLGAGRMGRGIAVVFAYSGHEVRLVDFKARAPDDFLRLKDEVQAELKLAFANLARLGLLAPGDDAPLLARIGIFGADEASDGFAGAGVIFEGIPEILGVKRDAFSRASKLADPDAIIASTTSTIPVDDLADFVERPERFLNAHWLNPAYLIPLVEMSPGSLTDPDVMARLKALLEGIGKVPVVCAPRPGFIVPRIQTLAMNEAARMVEEGVASAEDIDRAIRYGFGLRYACMGLLEFVDWGGGDILFYASRFLTGALGDTRYAAPPIIERNMAEGRIGMKTGQGFLDYRAIDVDAFRLERLQAMVALLRCFGLTRPPVLDVPRRAGEPNP
jgi:3-hydroxybutyryl-CoA dehydrogenase